MLAQPRWRASNIRHISRRLQSTLPQAEVGPSASSSIPPKFEVTAKLRETRRDESKTIFIRPWDGIHSMPEAYSIVRAIERKYGKIRDFKLLRDFDNSGTYQPFLWAEFKDVEAAKSLSTEASVLQVKVPIADKKQPGGIGLNDLQGLLDSGDKVNETDPEYQSVVSRMKTEKSKDDGSTRVIDIRIERTKSMIRYNIAPEYPGMGKKRILPIGKSFSMWGGFYVPPESLAASLAEELQGQMPSLPNQLHTRPRMRHAQKMWGKIISKSQQTQAETETTSAEDLDVQAESLEEDIISPIAELETLAREEVVRVQSEPTTEPIPQVTIETSSPSTPEETHRPPLTQTLTRRQRLLAQARETARSPLPEKLLAPTPEILQTKAEEEAQKKKKQAKATSSMKERLWKLIGGRWA